MDEDEARVAGWTIFGVLCGFKLITAAVVFIMLPSARAAAFLLIFNWFWLLPLLVLGAGGGLTWYRLLRARARRERLRRAEFLLDEVLPR